MSIHRATIGVKCAAITTLIPLLAFSLSGCIEPTQPSRARTATAGWTPLQLPGVSRDNAFEAGIYAVKQFIPSVTTSVNDGVVESVWVEYEQRGGTGRIRDEAIKYKNRLRHRIVLAVTPAGSGSSAQCQVSVQRLDTTDHRMFNQQSQFDDRNDQTPIDQDAGVSASQSEAWTDLPRDRDLERQVLDVLRNRVAGPPSAVSNEPTS